MKRRVSIGMATQFLPGVLLGWEVAFTSDSKLALVSARGRYTQQKRPDGTVHNAAPDEKPMLWLKMPQGEIHRLAPVKESGVIAITPDGKRFAVGNNGASHEIRIYDFATGKLQHTIAGLGAGVSCLAFSPDGKRLVAGLTDTSALVWDLAIKQLK